MLRATHAAPRLVLARHPVKERFDAFWLVRGRLVDWGPLPGASRAGRAHRGGAGPPAGPQRVPGRTRSTRCASWRAGSRTTSRRAGARPGAGARRAAAASPRRRCCDRAPSPPRRTARSAASNPIFEWVPSQNGFVVDPPQRQRAIASPSRQVVLVPVRVDQRHRTRDLVRPVVAHLYDHLFMAPILAWSATRGPTRPSRGARDRALPPLRGALPAAPARARARRGRGGRGARRRARGRRREPLAAGWAMSDRHTDLWAVNGSLAFPLERSDRPGRYVATTCLSRPDK